MLLGTINELRNELDMASFEKMFIDGCLLESYINVKRRGYKLMKITPRGGGEYGKDKRLSRKKAAMNRSVLGQNTTD